jgi:hypothetical protein
VIHADAEKRPRKVDETTILDVIRADTEKEQEVLMTASLSCSLDGT